jgi:hypothetical protein
MPGTNSTAIFGRACRTGGQKLQFVSCVDRVAPPSGDPFKPNPARSNQTGQEQSHETNISTQFAETRPPTRFSRPYGDSRRTRRDQRPSLQGQKALVCLIQRTVRSTRVIPIHGLPGIASRQEHCRHDISKAMPIVRVYRFFQGISAAGGFCRRLL